MSKYFNVDNFDEKYTAIREFIVEFPPINEKEFEAYTRLFWGKKLSIKRLNVYEKDGCSYELKEDTETYCTWPLYRKWRTCNHSKEIYQSKGLNILLDATFGDLSCGGIGRTHYGQTKHLSKERIEILNNWWGKGIVDDVKYYIREAAKKEKLKEILGAYPFRLKR